MEAVSPLVLTGLSWWTLRGRPVVCWRVWLEEMGSKQNGTTRAVFILRVTVGDWGMAVAFDNQHAIGPRYKPIPTCSCAWKRDSCEGGVKRRNIAMAHTEETDWFWKKKQNKKNLQLFVQIVWFLFRLSFPITGVLMLLSSIRPWC